MVGQAQFQSAAVSSGNAVASIGTKADAADKHVKDLGKTGSGLGSKFGTIKRLAGIAGFAGVGAAAFGAVKGAISFNAQLEGAQQRFSLFTKNARETRQVIASVNDVASKSTFARTELSDVAAQLGQAGLHGKVLDKTLRGVANATAAAGGGSERLQRITVAMRQIAAGGTIAADDVNQLADAGINVRAVLAKEFGLSAKQVKNIGDEGISSKRALDVLTKDFTTGKMAKAAQAQAQTTAGVWSNIVGRTQRELGQLFQPVYVWLGTTLLPFVQRTLPTAFRVLGAAMRTTGAAIRFVADNFRWFALVLGPLLTLLVTYKTIMFVITTATRLWAAAQLLLNTIMALNPIVLVIAAIVALGIAVVIAYHKFEWFRNAVNNVWNALRVTWSWVKSNWPLLLAILVGPFGLAVQQIAKHWDAIKRGAMGVVNWFKSLGTKIVSAIVDGINSMPTAVLDAITGALPGGAVGKAILDKIPGLQFGGVMAHAGYSVVGERGPELVQLPGGSRVTPLPAGGATAPAFAGGGGGLVQTTANFYLERRLIATAVAEDTSDRKARR